MPDPKSPRYYFALPRLLTRLRGGSLERCEQNSIEAAVAGTMVHTITFVFALRLLLADRATWQQLLLVLPVALLIWAWWSLVIYTNSLIINAARAAGLFRERANRHLQSVLIAIVTTVFAWQLVAAGSWMRLLGLIWITAVALNLAAAALLASMHAEPAR